MRTTLFALMSALALASCASPRLAQIPADPPVCPKPPPVEAWILEPEPSLLLKLDNVFSISAPASSASRESSRPASGN